MGKRARPRREQRPPSEAEKSEQDGRQRRVYQLGHSWVVGLPHWVRHRLGCVAGGSIYLHDEGREEVVLSALPVRAGARPSGLKLREELAHAKRRIAELETQRQVSREAIWNEFRTHEAMRLLKLQLTGYPAIDAINDRLRRIEDQLGTRRGSWTYRVKRGRGRSVETYQLPTAPEAPASTTPGPSDERTTAPEAEPPALPVET